MAALPVLPWRKRRYLTSARVVEASRVLNAGMPADGTPLLMTCPSTEAVRRCSFADVAMSGARSPPRPSIPRNPAHRFSKTWRPSALDRSNCGAPAGRSALSLKPSPYAGTAIHNANAPAVAKILPPTAPTSFSRLLGIKFKVHAFNNRIDFHSCENGIFDSDQAYYPLDKAD